MGSLRLRFLGVVCSFGVALGTVLATPALVTASTITEYPIPTTFSGPVGITSGPDGALWFAESENHANKIGRVTTGGTFDEFPVPTPPNPLQSQSGPRYITAGPDGALWFTENGGGKIGRITTAGAISEFPIPTPGSFPEGITVGSDGALWFAEMFNGGGFGEQKIGRVTTTGSFSEFPIPTPNGEPYGITAGPDGALWFTEFNGNRIGRVTTAGSFTEFTIPTGGPFGSSLPRDITPGPDGALWFTELFGNKIGRITTSGAFTEFPVPTPASGLQGITAGPDGALWFTELSGSNVGRITTAGSISEFPVPGGGPDEITTGPDGALWFSDFGGNKIGRISQAASEQPISNAQAVALNGTEGTNFCGTVATFSDADGTAVAADYTATIDWGDTTPPTSGVITGGGNGNFTVSGCHTYAEEGTFPTRVTITDVDNPSNSAVANSTASVSDAALSASCAVVGTSSQSFSGLTANFTDAASPGGTLSDFSATINWGDATSSAGTVSGPNGGPYSVSGTHTYASTGPFTITTTINDVGTSSTSTPSCTRLVFAFAPGGGAFVIGNNNSANGTNVTFWGAQWWKLNSLSGGSAPASFKGFAETAATPACGVGWSTDTGNSAPPPAGPLPAFMAVIVTSASAQSGSQISGNTVHMVVVQTNPGYAPAVGHAGIGVVVAQIC